MTTDDIRAFFTRFLAVWEQQNLSAIVACYTENGRIDSPMFHAIAGRADIQKSFSDLFRAFDDWNFRVDDIVIDRGPDDRAVLVYTAQMTHRGDLFGMPGTGRRIETSGALIIRFEDGRIASERRLYDFTGLLVQLGVLKARAV
jgi:steroid delta-isomerase-like uncharacterized protein